MSEKIEKGKQGGGGTRGMMGLPLEANDRKREEKEKKKEKELVGKRSSALYL